MRTFLIAVAAWTLLTLAFVLFYPNDYHRLPCMALVGRSAACEADQATINAALQTYQTIPVLAAIAAGYLAIVALRVRASRGSTRPR